MKREWQSQLLQALSVELGSDFGAAAMRPSGTGCINDTWEVYGRGIQSVFLKTGPVTAFEMYQKEQQGLDVLRQCDAIRVPQVLSVLTVDSYAVLVLEFIPMVAPQTQHDASIGQALAQLHSISRSAFGFDDNNFIGRTPQINDWTDDWWQFWCECRIRPQWRLARLRGMREELLNKIEKLIECIPAVFAFHQPQSVLLHGDLWNGNLAVDESGKPCLFDPAVYFGDAETDIAMTRMFGELRPDVYVEYQKTHPVKDDAERRRVLYDLYHWLNHFNLFGVTYLGQVENSVDHLLATME